MNITLTILVVESILVLVGICALLFYFRWKVKYNKLIDFKQLLDNFNDQEGERKVQLVNHLQEGYALSSEESGESADYMVEAEKVFLQQFMKQQIEQTSGADFYQNLCELLDQYLYFIPTKNAIDSNSSNIETTEAIEDSMHSQVDKEALLDEKNDDLDGSGEKSGLEDIITEQVNDSNTSEEDPDWGDAFAESGDEVDEQTKLDFDANNSEPSETLKESEEEPDWGEAFAESGDEIDEKTKVGYETDLQH